MYNNSSIPEDWLEDVLSISDFYDASAPQPPRPPSKIAQQVRAKPSLYDDFLDNDKPTSSAAHKKKKPIGRGYLLNRTFEDEQPGSEISFLEHQLETTQSIREVHRTGFSNEQIEAMIKNGYPSSPKEEKSESSSNFPCLTSQAELYKDANEVGKPPPLQDILKNNKKKRTDQAKKQEANLPVCNSVRTSDLIDEKPILSPEPNTTSLKTSPSNENSCSSTKTAIRFSDVVSDNHLSDRTNYLNVRSKLQFPTLKRKD